MIPIILKYWKQLTICLAIFGLLFAIHHSGYVAGKKDIQTQWDAQKLVDAEVAAKAAVKTATIVVKSETGTQDANLSFKKNIAKFKDHYNSGVVPTINYSAGVLDASVAKANSSTVSELSGNSGQSKTASADTVPRTELNQLANDCLATTIQLNNAQAWALEQEKIYNQ